MKLVKHLLNSLILGGLMLATPQQASAERGNPNVSLDGRTVDEMIATFMKQHDISGMTLAIVQAPYIPRVVGYGIADQDTKLLAATNTLWNIGQISCGYTAVAIMQLVEENKLKIDDPVGKFIPDLPENWKTITLRQLMGNASGLPDYTKQASFDFSKNYTPSEILALVKNVPVLFPAGSKVEQSGTNFYLLGLIIEKASGESYQSYVKKNQFERVGLKHTFFPSDLTDAQKITDHKEFLSNPAFINPSEVAKGYTRDGKPARVNNPSALTGYGSILASAGDISLWDISLAGSILVKNKENRDLIYSAITLNDGKKVKANAGWRFYGHKGLMTIHGDIPGFSCFLSRFTDPSELLCVTLCANKESIELSELARNIAGAFNRYLGPPVGPKGTRCFESCFDVSTTMDRFEEFLKSKGVSIMARVNHAEGASKANLTLRPTQTLIFGNPAVGTHLMLANQTIAIDLPLKAAVWQEENGSVWLGHDDIQTLAESYKITEIPEIIQKMTAGLSAAVKYAIEPY